MSSCKHANWFSSSTDSQSHGQLAPALVSEDIILHISHATSCRPSSAVKGEVDSSGPPWSEKHGLWRFIVLNYALSFWILLVPVYVCSRSSHSLLMSIMLNMQFPANVRVFQECTLLAVLIDSLESSSSFLQMQSVRLLSLPRCIHHILWYFWFPEPWGSKQGQVGCSTPCHPSIAGVSHPGKKHLWECFTVSRDCFTGFLDGPPAARPAACRKLWYAWSEKARRHGGSMQTEKKKAMKNELFHELFHALPILSWAPGTTSLLFVCVHACLVSSDSDVFILVQSYTIYIYICILYLCMHINIICYVMYVIFLRQQRHLLGSFLFVSASLVALEASKSSCSRESGMVWVTNIHLRHRLKAVAIRWYTRNSIFASNFKGFSPFEPAFHVPHESDVVCAKPSWTNENAGRSTWIFTFSGIIF